MCKCYSARMIQERSGLVSVQDVLAVKVFFAELDQAS